MLHMLRKSGPRNTAFTDHERVTHVDASPESRSGNRQPSSKGGWWVAVGVAILLNIFASGVPDGIHFTGGWVSRADAFHAPLEGFGATTSGGAGKPTYDVTNLNDGGPGSLRDAVSRGDRHIVFKVGGTISLKTDIWVKGASITIDGFSAPSPGITLRNHGLLVHGLSGAHDVIVRGIRVRNSLGCDSCSQTGVGIGISRDAYNVVVDHVSVQGTQDQAITVGRGAHDVTIQWSIFAQGQRSNLLVAIAGTSRNTGQVARRVSMHHNVIIQGNERMPKAVWSESGAQADMTQLDFRNNLTWDWNFSASQLWKGTRANAVNNYYDDPNASLNGQKRAIYVCHAGSRPPQCNGSNRNLYARAYVQGNVSGAGETVSDYLNTIGTESSPFPAPSISISGACTAAHQALAEAGAHPRDPTDQKYLSLISLRGCSSSAALTAPVDWADAASGTGVQLRREAMLAQVVDMPVAGGNSIPSDGLLRFQALSYHNVSTGPGILPGETEEDDALAMGDGTWAAYGPVQLDEYEAFNVRVASGGQGGKLEVRLESPKGPSIGSIPIRNTGGWDSWVTVTTRISPTPGLHLVYLTFSTARPDADEVVLVDRFEFVP